MARLTGSLQELQRLNLRSFRGLGQASLKSWILAATGVPGASEAFAQEKTQEFTTGRDEKLVSCTACHFESTDGDS